MIAVALAIATVVVAGGSGAAGEGLGLPNLRPIEPTQVFWGPRPDGSGVMEVRVAPYVENVGSVPLELRGSASTSFPDVPAEQCVSWANDLCDQWQPVGVFHQTFLPPQQCWRLDSSMAYELRRVLPDGTPDLNAAGLVASTIASRHWYDESPDYEHPANANGAIAGYPLCAAFVREGVSPGWVVGWDDDIPEQQIAITGVPDGDFALLVIVDPLNRIAESDDTDNTLTRRLRISGDGSQVELL